jgi:hypothetical protein
MTIIAPLILVSGERLRRARAVRSGHDLRL